MEETKEKFEEKIDKLYEKNLTYEEIISKPILQPILEVNSVYESQGLVVNRATFLYKQNLEEINEMFKKNKTYLQTIIIGVVQQLLNNAEQIIHSQDIQRDNLKRTIKRMLDIVEKNYTKNSDIQLPKKEKKIEEVKFEELKQILEPPKVELKNEEEPEENFLVAPEETK